MSNEDEDVVGWLTLALCTFLIGVVGGGSCLNSCQTTECVSFCRQQNALYVDQTIEYGCRCAESKNTFTGSLKKEKAP